MAELLIISRDKVILYQLMFNMLIHGGKYLWFFHSVIAWPKNLACSVNLIGKKKTFTFWLNCASDAIYSNRLCA